MAQEPGCTQGAYEQFEHYSLDGWLYFCGQGDLVWLSAVWQQCSLDSAREDLKQEGVATKDQLLLAAEGDRQSATGRLGSQECFFWACHRTSLC